MQALCLMVAMLAAPPAPAEDAMTADRLERLVRIDRRLVGETFRRHQGQVLPFVDGYLEGGLKIVEEGGDAEAVRASYRLGLEFASIASDTFGDEIYVRYAASFASWSPIEQQRFRAGQAAYRRGRGLEKDGDLDGALAAFTEGRDLAAPLGDAWGEAMCVAGIARVEVARDQGITARAAASRAVELYTRLRLHGSEIEARLVLAQIVESVSPGRGVNVLRGAWALASQAGVPEERRERVRAAYVASLRAADRDADADALERSTP